MRKTGLGMEQVLRNLGYAERLIEHLEERQTGRHVRNAVKEWLLATRSVIDSAIDTIEEDRDTPVARKINISKE